MKIIIDIPDSVYEHAKDHSEDSNDEYIAMRSIENGLLMENQVTIKAEEIAKVNKIIIEFVKNAN